MRHLDLANPSDWNFYIGSQWEKVFRAFEVPRDGVVVEIAPGDANKVGLGLREYGFNGHLYVIEPNGKTLAIVSGQYLQDFEEMTLLKKTLVDCLTKLPERVDAIIANHALDDMIIGMARDDPESQEFYDTHYGNNHGERTRQYWKELEAKPQILEQTKLNLLREWSCLFASTNPGLVALSQYESYFFKMNKIREPDKHALDLLKRMKTRFEKERITEDEERLLKGIFQYERWLFLKKP